MGRKGKQFSGILPIFEWFIYAPSPFPHPLPPWVSFIPLASLVNIFYIVSQSSFGSFSPVMLCLHLWNSWVEWKGEYQSSAAGSTKNRVTAHLLLWAGSRLTSLLWMSLCFFCVAHRAISEWQGKCNREILVRSRTEVFILLCNKPRDCPWQAGPFTGISGNSRQLREDLASHTQVFTKH